MSTTTKSITAFMLLAFSASLVQAADRPLRIVDEGETDRDWAPAGIAPLAQPSYPAVAGTRNDFCVAIGYKLNRDGSASDMSVLKAWSSAHPVAEPSQDEIKPFAVSAANAVSQWKFTAKPDASSNRVAYTAASVAFVGDSGSDAVSVRDHCRISGLKGHIAKLQDAANRGGHSEKDKYERMQRQHSPDERALGDKLAKSRR